MKNFKIFHNERGFVLLVVYVVVMFVTVFSVVLFARHRVAIQTTERYQNRILAFNAAESGIDFALKQLVADQAVQDMATQNITYTAGYTPMEQSGYAYTISPVPGQPSLRRIDAKGYAPSYYADEDAVKPRAGQKSEITVYCQLTVAAPPTSLFKYGVYAKDHISMSGNSAFDSYNSNYGAYGGSNKSSTGAMAVNSTEPGSLSLNGNAKINGSVLVGYNGDPDTVVTVQNATITGTRSTLPQDWTEPAEIEIPEGATPISLVVNGNDTITLAAGTYHASSLKVSGNGKIKTTGAVRIYVDGEIDITGNGVAVPNNHPANLLLYSINSASVKIAGNGSFYGGVYAPNSTVTANGNGDVFGAVIAKTYTQTGNSSTHFDLALMDLVAPDTDQTKIARITAWQELYSLAWDTGQTTT